MKYKNVVCVQGADAKCVETPCDTHHIRVCETYQLPCPNYLSEVGGELCANINIKTIRFAETRPLIGVDPDLE